MLKTYSMDEREIVKKLPMDDKVRAWLRNPWLLQHRPFRVIDNVYFVGTDWVSAFLLDTSAGLVLIDCAMQETWYLIHENIRALGFDPHDIRKLLLTHGHFDHCGAARIVQELSGCETWISDKEAFFFTERRDLIAFEETVPEFRIDRYYDYDGVIDCGNFQVRPVHCPGHTPGTTSLFFDVRHGDRTLTCAIHGGLGAVALSKKNLTESGLPLETREIYCESIDRVVDEKVDIVLPSHAAHTKNYDFFGIADADDGTGEGFIDPGAWKRMLLNKKGDIVRLMEADI